MRIRLRRSTFDSKWERSTVTARTWWPILMPPILQCRVSYNFKIQIFSHEYYACAEILSRYALSQCRPVSFLAQSISTNYRNTFVFSLEHVLREWIEPQTTLWMNSVADRLVTSRRLHGSVFQLQTLHSFESVDKLWFSTLVENLYSTSPHERPHVAKPL
jgi:hypothetical protein